MDAPWRWRSRAKAVTALRAAARLSPDGFSVTVPEMGAELVAFLE